MDQTNQTVKIKYTDEDNATVEIGGQKIERLQSISFEHKAGDMFYLKLVLYPADVEFEIDGGCEVGVDIFKPVRSLK